MLEYISRKSNNIIANTINDYKKRIKIINSIENINTVDREKQIYTVGESAIHLLKDVDIKASSKRNKDLLIIYIRTAIAMIVLKNEFLMNINVDLLKDYQKKIKELTEYAPDDSLYFSAFLNFSNNNTTDAREHLLKIRVSTLQGYFTSINPTELLDRFCNFTKEIQLEKQNALNNLSIYGLC